MQVVKILSGEEGSPKSAAEHPLSTTCFKCRKEGHQAAKCKSNYPTQNVTPESTKKPTKLPLQTCEIALEGVEIIKFTPFPQDGERTPTGPAEDPGESQMMTPW